MKYLFLHVYEYVRNNKERAVTVSEMRSETERATIKNPNFKLFVKDVPLFNSFKLLGSCYFPTFLSVENLGLKNVMKTRF